MRIMQLFVLVAFVARGRGGHASRHGAGPSKAQYASANLDEQGKSFADFATCLPRSGSIRYSFTSDGLIGSQVDTWNITRFDAIRQTFTLWS